MPTAAVRFRMSSLEEDDPLPLQIRGDLYSITFNAERAFKITNANDREEEVGMVYVETPILDDDEARAEEASVRAFLGHVGSWNALDGVDFSSVVVDRSTRMGPNGTMEFNDPGNIRIANEVFHRELFETLAINRRFQIVETFAYADGLQTLAEERYVRDHLYPIWTTRVRSPRWRQG